jgi:excisionase family DNA binding protein
MTDTFLTPSQLAELLQVPPETIRYWRKKKTGPLFSRIGRHIRYDRNDVTTWIQERKR